MSKLSNISNDKIPDGILALITQVILGVSLATSAVPPTVLSFQDRASETMGVFIVIVFTTVLALPIRQAFGRQDLTFSEYLVTVLAPIVTRLDLGLLIWVHVNKALLWVKQMLYATPEELDCVSLLILASRIWHNGDERILDPEFGYQGGEAGMLMYHLQKDYNPKNAGDNALAWVGHFTLYPLAFLFHLLLQIVSTIGYAVFWLLARSAHMTGHSRSQSRLKLRGTYFDFLLRTHRSQRKKLFMRREVASLFDSKQQLIKSNKNLARDRWAMLSNVDAIIRHFHFRKLLSIIYPMRAPLIYQRVLADPTSRDLISILNQENLLFDEYPDNPLSAIGEQASRQVILYRLLGWPKQNEYSRTCLERLTEFANNNMNAWSDTEKRWTEQQTVHAEFISVRDILRRNLVQLVMLAWSDGLGECMNDPSVGNVTADLKNYFLQAHLPGIEMAVRLCNLESDWNNEEQNSSMIKSLRGTLDHCECHLCHEMIINRRLSNSRYQSKPLADEMAEALQQDDCALGYSIGMIWKTAVSQWIKIIFEPQSTPIEHDEP